MKRQSCESEGKSLEYIYKTNDKIARGSLLVFKDQMTTKKLVQTSDFAKGMYFIKLEGENIFELKKVVKN